MVNRFLQRDKYTPGLLWEHIRADIEFSTKGIIIFDDAILENRNTKKIEIVRKQYSGVVGKVTTGIGVRIEDWLQNEYQK